MIIVRMEGGLGNLMFEYSLGRRLSYLHGVPLKFDDSHCKINPLGDYSLNLEAFNISVRGNIATQEEIARFKKYEKKPGMAHVLRNFLYADSSKYAREKTYNFDPGILALGNDAYLHGWWQSEKYFKDIREVLLQDFTARDALSGKNEEMAGRISSTNSVSIHVRRLDYVTNPKTRKVHGELPKRYYEEALRVVIGRIGTPVLFVFSDDTQWVKENFDFGWETHHIGWNDPRAAPHQDMRLMSLCKHNVVANSSFSWWGAWLNQNKEKVVIAPEPWVAKSTKENTKDVIPESWIKLDAGYLR